MDIVIDANIVISILLSGETSTRGLLFLEKLKIYAPEFLLEEVKKYKNEVIQRSKLSEEEFELALSLISSKINFIPFVEFEEFILEAKEICPDEKDVEYIALALRLNCQIWSNDKKLKEQNKVKVLNTKELVELLKI